MKAYDIIDLGCGAGESIKLARSFHPSLSGASALGVDLNGAHRDALATIGADLLVANSATMRRYSPMSCRIVVLSHALEHMWSWSEIEEVLTWSAAVATDCVWLANPVWDCVPTLRASGLSWRWADYADHRVAVNIAGLARLCAHNGIAHRLWASGLRSSASPGAHDCIAIRDHWQVVTSSLFTMCEGVLGCRGDIGAGLVSRFNNSPDHLAIY